MTSKTTNKFSPEVRARSVRPVPDHEADRSSRWTACRSIAARIGCSAHTLLDWVNKAAIDAGERAGLPTDMAERMKAPERENRELRQANEILRKASAYFAPAELDRPFKRRSRSLTITARRMGSSRSARFCRSPRRPIAITWRSGPIRIGSSGCPRRICFGSAISPMSPPGGFRRCGVRHRRLCPADRRLAGERFRPWRLRARRPRTGCP